MRFVRNAQRCLFPACLAIGLVAVAIEAAPPRISLVPQPAHVTVANGHFTVEATTPVVCTGGESDCRWVADYFVGLVRRARTLPLSTATDDGRPSIAFTLAPQQTALGKEGYRLIVSERGIRITAATRAGLLYGAVTLWQLMTETEGRAKAITVPAVDIADAPRFAWRGMLLDSCRHFQSVEFVKAFIDTMAQHKLNVFHWHLSDDQGWRLEIKKYPKLTAVGAWRHPAGAAHQTTYGGYYTQDEVRDVVAYAAARNVTIVPEIEMPGHAAAAIAAYPEFGSGEAPAAVPSDWGVLPYLYAPEDKTYAFLEDVLTEVMDLFPSRYIHIGGDEAIKNQWNDSPQIRAQIAALHLADADALQSHFVQRIETFLNAHGRRMIGWDEILQGGIADDATITSWHGVSGGIAAAKLGHDAILSPAPLLYFDNRQAGGAGEPSGRGPVISLKDVYDFDPAPKELTAAELPHILGVQANIWTEYLPRESLVANAAFPRAAALAETGWSTAEAKSWPSFIARMGAQYGRYRMLAVPHSESALAVTIAADPTPAGARVRLSNQAQFGDIRYTRDGTPPTAASPRYEKPFDVKRATRIAAAAFDGTRRLTAAKAATIDNRTLFTRSSNDMQICNKNDEPLAIEDDAGTPGQRAVFLVDVLNPCWVYERADLSQTVALEVRVGQLPYNLKLGNEKIDYQMLPPATPEGELEVRIGSPTGERIAVLPLAPTKGNDAITTLKTAIAPRPGLWDLCFVFTRRSPDPVWTVDTVRLVQKAP